MLTFFSVFFFIPDVVFVYKDTNIPFYP